MPDVNPSIINAAFKGLPASFLSPLTSALDGEGAGSGPFSSLLSQIVTAEAQSTSAPVADTSAQNTSADASSATTVVPFPDTSALKQVLNYIRAQQNGRQSSQSPMIKDNAASSSDGANSGTSDTTPTTTPTVASTTNTTGGTTTSNGSGAKTNNSNAFAPDAQIIAEALLELQQLLQWLAQHLSLQVPVAGQTISPAAISALFPDAASPATTPNTPPSSSGAATPSSAPASGTPVADGSASGTPSPADALAAFLALLQTIEKQLAGSSTSGATANGADTTPAATMAASTATTAGNAALSAQIAAALKKLDAALEAEITGATQANANSNTNTGTTTTTDQTTSTTTANVTSAATAKTFAVDNLLSSVNPTTTPAANNLFRLLGEIFGTATQAAAMGVTTNDMSLMAGGNGGMGADTGQGDNGAAASGMATTYGSDALPLTSAGVQSASLFSFSSQLSAVSADTNQLSLPSVIDQVILSLNRSVKNGDSQMSIQLQPADLGHINIKLDISSDGKVQGTVVADNQSTLDQLLKDVRSLERALQEAGLRADPGSLQFSLGGQQQPGGGFAGAQSGNSSGGASADTSSGAVPASDALVLPIEAEIYYLTPTGVNIKV
jgi:hypothetical protein